MEGWQKENVITIICMTVLILSIYYMSHSMHSLWGFLLLLNLNTPKFKKDKTGVGYDK